VAAVRSVQTRNDADFFRRRLDVDARDLGRRKQQPAFGGVVAKFRPDPQDEVGFRQQMLRRCRGKRASDPDVPRMSGEIPLALQRRRKQCPDPVGQFDDCILRARRSRTPPGDDYRPFRRDQFVDNRL
jgi:hypothetical protein